MLRRNVSCLSGTKRPSFTYERAITKAPSQLFSRDALIPSLSSSSSSSLAAAASSLSDPRLNPQQQRRWMRSANESCIESLTKSTSLLTSYEVSYRFNDPQWLPMLQLPCGNPISLELRARHINYALRHLVQKGHALYLVHKADHSVVHPKGLAAVSHVVCSLDGKYERLLTSIVHEGPIDASDPDGEWGIVAASDARALARAFQRREMLWMRSRRIGSVQAQMGTFDWTTHHPPDVGRTNNVDVMLLRNETEFIGPALCTRGIVSSANIAQHPFHYVNEFEAPATCAADAFHQAIHLTAANSQLVGATRGEQLQAVAWKMRQFFPYNPIELDLPFQIMCGPPQVYRGMDLAMVPPPQTGLPYIRPKDVAEYSEEGDPRWKSYGNAALDGAYQDVTKMKEVLAHEAKMRTMGAAAAGDAAETTKKNKKKKKKNSKTESIGSDSSSSKKPQKQLALLQFDLGIKQGASEYLYDQGNSSRAPYFWSQRNALPYDATFWCVRDGLLDTFEPIEIQPQFERMRSRLHTTSKQQKRHEQEQSDLALRDRHEEKKGGVRDEDEEDEHMLQSQSLDELLSQRHDKRKQREQEAARRQAEAASPSDPSLQTQWKFKQRTRSPASSGPFAGAEEDPASIEKQAEVFYMLEDSARRESKLRAASKSKLRALVPLDLQREQSSRVAARQQRSKKALERVAKAKKS